MTETKKRGTVRTDFVFHGTSNTGHGFEHGVRAEGVKVGARVVERAAIGDLIKFEVWAQPKPAESRTRSTKRKAKTRA